MCHHNVMLQYCAISSGVSFVQISAKLNHCGLSQIVWKMFNFSSFGTGYVNVLLTVDISSHFCILLVTLDLHRQHIMLCNMYIIIRFPLFSHSHSRTMVHQVSHLKSHSFHRTLQCDSWVSRCHDETQHALYSKRIRQRRKKYC